MNEPKVDKFGEFVSGWFERFHYNEVWRFNVSMNITQAV